MRGCPSLCLSLLPYSESEIKAVRMIVTEREGGWEGGLTHMCTRGAESVYTVHALCSENCVQTNSWSMWCDQTYLERQTVFLWVVYFLCHGNVLLFIAESFGIIGYLITLIMCEVICPRFFYRWFIWQKNQTRVMLSGLPVLPVEWEWRHLKIHTHSAIISVSVQSVYYCSTDFTIHSIINTPRWIKYSIEFWTSQDTRKCI